MSRSTVLFGFGCLGAAAARAASAGGDLLTVVEQDDVKAARAAKAGYKVIVADALLEKTHQIAQIATADKVIICTGSPSRLRLLETTRRLSPHADVRVMASGREQEEELLAAGASFVVVLPRITGELLAGSTQA